MPFVQKEKTYAYITLNEMIAEIKILHAWEEK